MRFEFFHYIPVFQTNKSWDSSHLVKNQYNTPFQRQFVQERSQWQLVDQKHLWKIEITFYLMNHSKRAHCWIDYLKCFYPFHSMKNSKIHQKVYVHSCERAFESKNCLVNLASIHRNQRQLKRRLIETNHLISSRIYNFLKIHSVELTKWLIWWANTKIIWCYQNAMLHNNGLSFTWYWFFWITSKHFQYITIFCGDIMHFSFITIVPYQCILIHSLKFIIQNNRNISITFEQYRF